jgi:hypothetical protein
MLHFTFYFLNWVMPGLFHLKHVLRDMGAIWNCPIMSLSTQLPLKVTNQLFYNSTTDQISTGACRPTCLLSIIYHQCDWFQAPDLLHQMNKHSTTEGVISMVTFINKKIFRTQKCVSQKFKKKFFKSLGWQKFHKLFFLKLHVL